MARTRGDQTTSTEPGSSPAVSDGEGRAGRRAVSSLGFSGRSFAIRVSFSSAKACAVRPMKRATSTVPGKETDAKLHVLACATIAPEAPCLEKKRMSSSSSRSEGRPARISLSPKAWQPKCRFGLSTESSPPPVRGRSRVKQPNTERFDRLVFERNTSFASGVPELFSSSSDSSGTQKVTSSPTASRTWPQASRRTGTSAQPCASLASSLAMAPNAVSRPVLDSAGSLTTTPENLQSFLTRAAWG
mmetsp:Transcript_9825/g.29410  ORF Transcript_9825/g.29410 Transcript_9825/m.29410 type:complete len:245 (+) Transcript_9825:514-1248(+)